MAAISRSSSSHSGQRRGALGWRRRWVERLAVGSGTMGPACRRSSWRSAMVRSLWWQWLPESGIDSSPSGRVLSSRSPCTGCPLVYGFSTPSRRGCSQDARQPPRRDSMVFELPALPYDRQALEPHISARTLEGHYGGHHRAHVARLNALVAGSELAGHTLEELLQAATGELFDQAAEVWNHTFHWHCLSPHGGGELEGALAEAIAARFGSFAAFKEVFAAAAAANVGSGWAWLVRTADGGVELLTTRNADTPIAHGRTPLLAVDVWEHAYYLDYRNDRAAYLEAIWALVNWEFVARTSGPEASPGGIGAPPDAPVVEPPCGDPGRVVDVAPIQQEAGRQLSAQLLPVGVPVGLPLRDQHQGAGPLARLQGVAVEQRKQRVLPDLGQQRRRCRRVVQPHPDALGPERAQQAQHRRLVDAGRAGLEGGAPDRHGAPLQAAVEVGPELAEQGLLLLLVDVEHLLEQRRAPPAGGLHVGQPHQVTGEVGAPEAAARIEVLVADPRVRPHALSHVLHVDAEAVGQAGHLVHVADAGGQHAVDGQLGQLGGPPRHGLDHLAAAVEGAQQLAHPGLGIRLIAAQQPA